MVKITERVINTYFAQLYFGKVINHHEVYVLIIFKSKENNLTIFFLLLYILILSFLQPGEDDILSVDARPSDAINVAIRCKVCITSTWLHMLFIFMNRLIV